MQTKYLEGTNFCVHADYKLLPKKSFWGYDIQVHNFAAEDAPPHKPRDSGSFLCAKIVNASAGQLAVAPCFLPSQLAGPYWVLAYDESEGYALISGGAPTESAPGGCRTGSGVNNAGLWIFTRSKRRDEKLVQKVRGVAREKGFDLSVLNFVNQSACSDAPLVDPEAAQAAPQLSAISNPFLAQKSTFTV
jgi:lipocalin